MSEHTYVVIDTEHFKPGWGHDIPRVRYIGPSKDEAEATVRRICPKPRIDVLWQEGSAGDTRVMRVVGDMQTVEVHQWPARTA